MSVVMIVAMVVTSLLAAVPIAEAATSSTTLNAVSPAIDADLPTEQHALIGPTNTGVLMQTSKATLWLSRSSGREGDLVHWKASGDFGGRGQYLLLGPCSSMYEGPSMCGRYFRSDVPAPNGREFSGSFYVRDMSKGLGNRPSAFWFQYSSADGRSGFESAQVPFTFLPSRTPNISVKGSVINGGTRVSITGVGFTPWGDDVNIRWGGPNGHLLTSIRLQHNEEYVFTTTFLVPTGVSGTVQIYASQSVQLSDRSFVTRTATTTITVRPPYKDQGTLRLTPATGPSGQYTAVYGTGYQPGELVDIRWQTDTGPIIGTIRVRDDGTYLGRITTRQGPAGSNRVFATGRSSLHRSMAWYQITSSAPTMVLRTSHTQTQSGAVITVTGSGYQPNEPVQIRWISQSGTLLGTVRANSSGTISGKITIPQATNKNYQIFATGTTSKRYGSVVHQVRNYTMSARALVSPNFGQSGNVVTVTGSGYQPGERVELRWGSMGGPVIGVVTANGSGSFSGRVTTRSGNPGTTYVVAVGTTSYRYSSAPYTITASPSGSGQLNVSHLTVRPGYVIMTNGTGWTPGQQLELRWGGSNGHLLGRVQVRSNGAWSGRVTIPTSARPGTYYLYAITPSGYTSVRITVSGTSIASVDRPIMVEDFVAGSEPKVTPEIVITPVASPIAVPTKDAPVGTPVVEPTGEIVGTPGVEPTEDVIDDEPDGTPPAVGDGDIDEDQMETTPEPVNHDVTVVVVDQHGAVVPDACIEATNLATGGVVTACDTTHDGLSDGRVELVEVEEGTYQVVVKNLPGEVNAIPPKTLFLDGSEIRIQVDRQPPPETPDPTVPDDPIHTDEEEPESHEESESDPGDDPGEDNGVATPAA